MIIRILFCCQKAFILYCDSHRNQRVVFQESIGRKYISDFEIKDKETIEKYQQGDESLYVIDVPDKLGTDKNINLEHVGVIMLDNVFNIGVYCFMSCLNCKETNCPGKSPCSKFVSDILRLWNTLGYSPKLNKNDNLESQLKTSLQQLYFDQKSGIYQELPKFVKQKLTKWNLESLDKDNKS